MTDRPQRSGASGVFHAIVDGARDIARRARALSEGDATLPPEVEALCNNLALAFVGGRFADAYALTATNLQQRQSRDRFEAAWRDASRDHGPFTGFGIANLGKIDLAFIPGLEDVPQAKFMAFVELTFSTAERTIEDDKAFTLAAVLLDQAGEPRIGDLHTRA